MKTWKFVQSTAIALACSGTALPQAVLAGPQDVVRPQTAAPAPLVSDVSLSADGLLHGQVVDGQGFPMAELPVSIRSGANEVATTVTDTQGNFAVGGLRGGNYMIVAGEGQSVIRLWTAQAAPPAAKSGLLLVSSHKVARGQNSPNYNALIIAAGAGIIAGGLIAEGVNKKSGS